MSDQRSYADMSDSEKKKEDWMNAKWRPAMGWLYMLVCLCDFVLFPVLHAIYVAALFKNGVTPTGVPGQWQPLTLQGAGLFHLAMGAVLGLAAFGRTQEKIAGANNGGLQSMGGSGFGAPSTGGFGAPAPASFGATSTPSSFGGGGFGGSSPMVPRSTTVTTTSTFGAPAAPMMSSSGKLGPAPAAEPEL